MSWVSAGVVVAGVAAGLAPPGPTAPTTATSLRLTDHPAFVRAVVAYPRGAPAGNQIEATDPAVFDGRARLRIQRSQLDRGLVAITRTAHGLTVRVAQVKGPGLRVDLRSARRRFKYVSYSVLGGRRLAIDAYKSAPPVRAAEIRRGTRRCLTLTRARVVRAGVVSAAGREQGLPEQQFQLVLRRRDGRVLARLQTTATRRWSARLRYRLAGRQPGTLEAAAASLKDGALACLVQVRVSLPPSR
jgi:hypothetical protein